MVRGKFRVEEIAQVAWSKDARKVRLSAVMDGSTEENRRFARATPSGSIEMTIDNPPASEYFAIGKTFYVDFTAAEYAMRVRFIVSGQAVDHVVLPGAVLDEAITAVLHKSGNTGQPPSGWELRDREGVLLDRWRTPRELAIKDSAILFLNPHAGVGGATGVRRVAAAAVLALAALAGPALAADAPVVAASPAPTFTWTPYSFTETAFTVGGNKRQIVGARFLGHLRLPYRLHVTARVDATATQDGGAVEVNAADPNTFSSLESYVAIERELYGPLTALAVYGLTLPIESGHLQVLDRYPKTYGFGVGLHVGHSWIAFAAAPRHDPAGSGLHFLIGGSIQVESHTFLVGDTALGRGSYWRGGVGVRLK